MTSAGSGVWNIQFYEFFPGSVALAYLEIFGIPTLPAFKFQDSEFRETSRILGLRI